MDNEQLYNQINELLRTELPTIGEYKENGETISNFQKWSSFEVGRGNDKARLLVIVWKRGFEVDQPYLRASFGLLGSGPHLELVNVIAGKYEFEPDGSHYQTPHQFNRYESFCLKCSSLGDANRVLAAVRDYFRVISDEQLLDLEKMNREKINRLTSELDQTRTGLYAGLELLVKGK
jgi:hypothetical protein